jgi:AcrR family transcriptional regulator
MRTTFAREAAVMRDTTGRGLGLNRAGIVAVARRIADTEGLEAATLRRVAGELGTGQASLYRHIADRAELLALLADDLAAGYPIVAAAGSPLDALAEQWTAMYDYLAEHPWGARVIADGGFRSMAARPVLEHCLGLLAKAGLDDEAATRTYRALWPLLIGHLLNEHPFGHATGAVGDARRPDRSDFEWALRRLLAGVGRMEAWHR